MVEVRVWTRFVVCAGAVALASCKLPVDTRSDAAIAQGEPGWAEAVQVRYLGVAGFLIRRGPDVILTAPLYSNPDLGHEAFGTIFPDKARILRFHPADAPAADAILVGHAHYDHLMDVPYVRQLRPGGRIYGSATTKNILAAYNGQTSPGFPTPVPVIATDQVIALDDPKDAAHFKVDARNCQGTPPSVGGPGAECAPWPDQRGDWESVKPTVRIRALCARHPPQLEGFHQAPGCIDRPLTRLPERAAHYLEGAPLVYLIDFLDGQGRPVFRVYYQDVPSDGALGKIPDDLIAERPVDLALLCVGNWNMVQHGDAATIVRNLRPQNVLLGHWEDFFKDQSTPPTPAPLQPVSEYHALVKKELKSLACPSTPRLSLPAPQVLKVFMPQAGSCTLR